MSLANLTAGQFLVLFAGGAAMVTLLYLLDRTKRRRVVPSLRFWRTSAAPAASRRWRIREPWSLALQVAGLALLLLAIAGLRTGDPDAAARDHIVIIDASAWMAAESQAGPLIHEVRSLAERYVRSLPAGDRVMVIRGEALPGPLTGFEEERETVIEAVRSCEPGPGAIDIRATLDLARRLQSRHARRPGEVVYVGGTRTQGAAATPALRNLRVLAVDAPASFRNVGLRRAGLRRSPRERNQWEIYVASGNDGTAPERADLSAQFAGAPAVYRRLELAPGAEIETTFPLRTQAEGDLDITLLVEDDFAGDNQTRLRLPARAPMRVAVYSRRPEQLRPLLEASPMVAASYLPPGAPPPTGTELVVLHRCARPEGWGGSAIWIEPPEEAAPLPVARRLASAPVAGWNSDHPLGAGLRTDDLELAGTLEFRETAGMETVARTAGGAVIVADEKRKWVVLGFDPTSGDVRYRLTAPLLFANALRWMRPDVFQQWEINLAAVGAVSLPLGPGVTRGEISVVDDREDPLPFELDGETLRFYGGRPGTVRVRAGEREVTYSLGLPRVPEAVWEPPAGALAGIPPARGSDPSRALWPWLALGAACVLAAEWWRYGRAGVAHRAARPLAAPREKAA